MDPIAHTLVGAALAQSGLGRKTRHATAALVIGANLPDIDAFSGLEFRRGWTHGLAAIVVLPLVLTGLLLLVHRWRQKPEDDPASSPRASVLLGLSFLAILTHPFLDWLNTYGIRLLMPWDGRWFYGDAVYIVDPWMWLVLGAAVFVAHSRTRRSLILWAAGALLPTALILLTLPSNRWGTQCLWLLGLIVAVAVRRSPLSHTEAGGRRLARVALASITLYIGLMITTSLASRAYVTGKLRERGLHVQELMVGPVPGTPFARDVVAATPEGYHYGELRLLPRPELRLDPEVLPKPDDSPAWREALKSKEIRGFMNWVRFPFVEIEPHDRGYTIWVMDARYTRSRTSGFGTARVEVETP